MKKSASNLSRRFFSLFHLIFTGLLYCKIAVDYSHFHTCRRFSQILVILLCSIALATFAMADAVNYFYDDTGRLARALKGTTGITYQYDSVGNLLSINKGTVGTGPPVLNSIIPDVVFIGSSTPAIISGQNLFTTKEVTSDNALISIQTLNVGDTEIRTEITVSPDALPGSTVHITVTTLYGSASVQATLTSSELTFNPGHLSLTPSSSGSITASIFPSIGRSLTIMLNNGNPSIVSAPQSVTIPSGGTTTFTVNALIKGVSTIDSGDPKTIVFVTDPFTLPPGEEVVCKSGPISVYIESSTTANTTTLSLPVSVYIEQPPGYSTVVALPVSAKINPP